MIRSTNKEGKIVREINRINERRHRIINSLQAHRYKIARKNKKQELDILKAKRERLYAKLKELRDGLGL